MKEKLKEPKGITLIALIITIILLLILAMVSIGAIREEGIIKHAENAADIFNKAKDNQTEQISLMEQELNKYGNTTTETTEWWRITDEEEASMLDIGDSQIPIAFSSDQSKMIVVFSPSNNMMSGIVVGNRNNGEYIIYFTDEIYNNPQGGDVDDIKETYKWYTYGGTGFEQIDPYTGTGPVSLEDFDTIASGCEDVVQRIINSFNN